MTSELLIDWLTAVYNNMKKKNRRILLIVDNCSAHPDMQISNIKLVFLPPNTISKLQSCDAGIKKLLWHILIKMDECSIASKIAKTVTILDAIVWIKTVWDTLQASTIQKCFGKCGFIVNTESIIPAGEDGMEDMPAQLEKLLNGTTLEQQAEMENNLETSNGNQESDQEKEILMKSKADMKSKEANSDSDAST